MLIERFGYRTVAMAASFGMMAAQVMTSFAPNVPFLFFSQGFLVGKLSSGPQSVHYFCKNVFLEYLCNQTPYPNRVFTIVPRIKLWPFRFVCTYWPYDDLEHWSSRWAWNGRLFGLSCNSMQNQCLKPKSWYVWGLTIFGKLYQSVPSHLGDFIQK